MPKELHGKKLTSHEHNLWKSAYESAQAGGAQEPGAVATAAVKKQRAKKKKGFKKR
uniref:Uncharacterized protein n=1 Tax=viral metagenome TaxID=1070528 RepID=A0A6M3LL19_9ZZZZ